jgi:hypothetical protein
MAGVIIVGTSAGVAWLFVFGDNPWPPVTESVLLLLGIAGAVLVAIAVIRTWYIWGKERDGSPSPNSKSERRRAMALLIAPASLMLFVVAALWLSDRNSPLRSQRAARFPVRFTIAP